MSFRMSSVGPRRPRNNSLYPRMTVRRLLKSCAMPPANRPTASIFCACRNCASVSRNTPSVLARSPNWPILRPMSSTILNNSSSGCLTWRLKSSMTPSISFPTRIGNPSAPWNPTCRACAPRVKSASIATSVTQADLPLVQMHPGKPSPRVNTRCQVSRVNGSACTDGVFH